MLIVAVVAVFLSLKGGGTGLTESTVVKMSHCWKSHVVAHICLAKLLCNRITLVMLKVYYCIPPRF